VLDVRKSEGTETEGTQGLALKKREPEKGIKKAKGPDSRVSLARQLGLNVSRVVIDPGHGGKDPGCRVRGGIEEKDITLKIAKLLVKKLEQELGCKVFLTRDKDTYLPLERRTAIANMKKADLFISLHVNAHRNSRIHGLETYFLNIATDEGAVMVAARENATSQKNISDLQLILNDLMLNTKILESSRLAYQIQKGMVSGLERHYSSVRDLGVKQAPFYVLIGAEMPAVLIEVGFLTNPMDKKMLLSKKYQERVADGISRGIKDYIASIEKVYQGG
jgi:N-acetylmuramoyl-L-alanine amidase